MISNILELLQAFDYHDAKSENIHFAKGAYRYPRTFRELFKTVRRWQLRRRLK